MELPNHPVLKGPHMTRRKNFHWKLSILAAVWVSPAGALGAIPERPIPFAQFIQDTRSARFEDYARQRSAVRDPRNFEEMKAHILRLYEGVHPTNSFFENGSFVDCVPLRQQPGLRGALPARPDKAAIAPAQRRGASIGGRLPATRALDLTLKPNEKDRFGSVKYCRSGTIPMRRITLEEMSRFDSLGGFLRRGKSGEGERKGPELPADSSSHYYARGLQYVDNLGGDAWLNVWSPTVADSRMSLSQLWVVGEGSNPKQTVEAGWQVYPSVWDSDNAALFIFYTSNDYKDGCYNTECDKFVQVASNVYLGNGFDHYSTSGGGQWGFNLQWKRSNAGNWWLFYKGPGNYIAVGYYPKSLFGTGYLSRQANKIAFGGEDTGKPSAKQMGSGSLAANGWTKAAFQKSVFYIDTNVVSQWNNLTKYESDPSCYTADIHNIYGSWGTHLYFGGPSCH
jgi:hypothetical protein